MPGAPEYDSARPLPQSLEAERAVLGGIMLDGSQALSIAEVLDPDDFYRKTTKQDGSNKR